jgi:hypothetical protein
MEIRTMRDRLELRALDPVARCLIRRLIVPRIYFEADWPADEPVHVDVLAIDRDGVGDAHLVEVRRNAADALARARLLLDASAPFRWVAFLAGTEDAESARALASHEPLCNPARPGRVGVIELAEMPGGDLEAKVRVTAERFFVTVHEVATAFSASHKAHIQFGD